MIPKHSTTSSGPLPPCPLPVAGAASPALLPVVRRLFGALTPPPPPAAAPNGCSGTARASIFMPSCCPRGSPAAVVYANEDAWGTTGGGVGPGARGSGIPSAMGVSTTSSSSSKGTPRPANAPRRLVRWARFWPWGRGRPAANTAGHDECQRAEPTHTYLSTHQHITKPQTSLTSGAPHMTNYPCHRTDSSSNAKRNCDACVIALQPVKVSPSA